MKNADIELSRINSEKNFRLRELAANQSIEKQNATGQPFNYFQDMKRRQIRVIFKIQLQFTLNYCLIVFEFLRFCSRKRQTYWLITSIDSIALQKERNRRSLHWMRLREKCDNTLSFITVMK